MIEPTRWGEWDTEKVGHLPCGGGLVQASVADVERPCREVAARWHTDVVREFATTDATELASHVARARSLQPKHFVFAHRAGWTLLLGGGGDDALGQVGLASDALPTALCIHAVFYSNARRYVEFLGGRDSRAISCLDDGGNRWKYYEKGPRLPFEEVEAYQRKRKSKRLTPEMVLRYVKHRTGFDFPRTVDEVLASFDVKCVVMARRPDAPPPPPFFLKLDGSK